MNRFASLGPFGRAAVLFCAALIGVMLLGLFAEGTVRLRQYLKHGLGVSRVENLYRHDPASGLRVPVAGFRSERVNINSLGFRGPEIASPKPPGTVRIAFLGASTTFCLEVSGDELTWPHLVVEALKARWPERSFDYVNAAVPGYTVKSSLQALNARVTPLTPDVIFIYHATNDLSVNSRAAAQSQGIARDEERADKGLSWLAKYSLLSYLVEKNLMIFKRQREADRPENKLKVDWRELAAPFARDLVSLVRASQQVARVVVLPTFSVRIRPEQGPDERIEAAVTSLYYMPYMTPQGLIEAFAAYNDTVRAVAAETGATLIDVAGEIPGDSAHFVDSVHFTDAGSRAMADLVVRNLLHRRSIESLDLVAAD